MCYVCLSVMVFLRTQKHEIHQILCISAHFHLNNFPTQTFFRTHLSHVICCFSITASVQWILFAVNEVFLFFTEISCLWYEKKRFRTLLSSSSYTDNVVKFSQSFFTNLYPFLTACSQKKLLTVKRSPATPLLFTYHSVKTNTATTVVHSLTYLSRLIPFTRQFK